MDSFLKSVVEHIYSRYGDELENCCLVFPGRRPAVYCMRQLSLLADKPTWSPAMITISELFSHISGKEPADPLTLIMELYRVFCEKTGSTESFDEFYFWGEVLLSDFDDLDKHLVNAAALFTNLSDLKQIDNLFDYLTEDQLSAIRLFWKNIDTSIISREKTGFQQMWASMLPVYQEFNAALSRSSIPYEGMICREVAERISAGETISLPWKKIFIIGFSALNASEKSVFQYLKGQQLAEFFWDYDEVYVMQENHEAGTFLRENLRDFPSVLSTELFRNLNNQGKTVSIISEPSWSGQAVIPGAIFKSLEKDPSFAYEKAAIVLADEGLLLPTLYSLPENCADINITMGLPITETNLFSFIDALIQLNKNVRLVNNQLFFYHRNVVPLLRHRYLNTAGSSDSEQLVRKIRETNSILISQEELSANLLYSELFVNPGSVSAFSNYLLKLLHQVYDGFSKLPEEKESTSLLEKEIIFKGYLSLKRLDDLLTGRKIEIELNTYKLLVRRLLQSQKINFSGEPLKGLQVMGLLETRALDFEYLVVLSVNEDILPKKAMSHSFIPFNLRNGFGMSTPERQDAIYAYYFYRLIQRAKNIHLVYSSKTQGMIKGQMSRYLYQLLYDSNLKVVQQAQNYSMGILQPKVILIEKDKSVQDKFAAFRMDSASHKMLSPSAITTYLECSLKFYFRYIAEMKESKEVSEEIDAPLFGNILHNAIHSLYEPYIGSDMNVEAIQKIIDNKKSIAEAIAIAVQEGLTPGKVSHASYKMTGKNSVIEEILKKYIDQLLFQDKQLAPIHVIGLERAISVPYEITLAEKKIQLRMGGKIDRIDSVAGETRIIDYKTGKTGRKISSISSLFDQEKPDKHPGIMQVLTYCYMYGIESKTGDPAPGLYFLRELFSDSFDYHIIIGGRGNAENIQFFSSIAEEFNARLTEVITEIFDPKKDFVQTAHPAICKRCEFANICHRG